MWNLDFESIKAVAQDFAFPVLAVETGTCRGATTRKLAQQFKQVVSVELHPTLAQEAKQAFATEKIHNVRIIEGNSAVLLPKILQDLSSHAPVFFFLDAHWSGDKTVNWSQAKWKGYGLDTAHLSQSTPPSGPEQCPLLDELRAIALHCRGPALILIDDLKNIPETGPGLRDHEFPGEDWSHLSRDSLLSIVASRLASQHVFERPERWLLSLRGVGC